MATRRDGFQFPCGQCLNCRINHRRGWQSRLLLEAASHACSVFATFTFADRGTPEPLRRSVLRGVLQRLAEVQPVRHFAAAEYGTKRGRAHYHVHLFTAKLFTDKQLAEAWPFGSIHVGSTEPASLDYTLGYLLKPRKEKRWPIETRWPEFRSFSQGIGKLALPHLLLDGTELPVEYRVFGKLWPIPRYLRDRAKKMGFTVSERTPQILARLESEAMRTLLLDETSTPQQIESAYEAYWQAQALKRRTIRNKAIRDSYREKLENQLKRNIQNETF